MLCCFSPLLSLYVDDTYTVVGGKVLGVSLNGLVVRSESLVVLLANKKNLTQLVVCRCVARINLEYLGKFLFCLAQSALQGVDETEAVVRIDIIGI